jgi:hypothetical protein
MGFWDHLGPQSSRPEPWKGASSIGLGDVRPCDCEAIPAFEVNIFEIFIAAVVIGIVAFLLEITFSGG